MNIEQISVELTCLFCGQVLTGDEDATFESGDLIECNSCGESNDYDSVLEVAVEKGTKQIADEVTKDLSKTLNKMFKGR